MKKKLAVILTNLGGPDCLQNVRPFLYNLFSDPAIIALPSPIRQILAWFIARKRTQKAQGIYKKIGGKSPLLSNTQSQQKELQKLLTMLLPNWNIKVFIAMRYWHPLINQTITEVEKWGADLVVHLPLYPQFSTTTTASNQDLFEKLTPQLKTLSQGCYFSETGFIQAYQDLIQKQLDQIGNIPVRLLFSAHGIPQKLIDQGDPYQWQVEQSTQAVMANFDQDYRICYQSRVGPLKWLGPSLDEELIKAAEDKMGVMIIPISFVSEHSETLVELDMDFKERSQELGISRYCRVATVGTHPNFIQGLANLVVERVNTGHSYQGNRCPENFVKCRCRP